MKTNHTDEQLQNAIDAACEEASKLQKGGLIVIDACEFPLDWQDETPARLHLLKTALDLLPDTPPPVVDGKTPGPIIHKPASQPAVEDEQADPYADLKAAHAAGKVIQWHNGHMWHDLTHSENPLWIHPAKDYRIKPEPSTFEAHGKTWTPKVGALVRLKSGGPKMTVDAITGVNAFCRWFDMNGSNQLNFNLATLQPA